MPIEHCENRCGELQALSLALDTLAEPDFKLAEQRESELINGMLQIFEGWQVEQLTAIENPNNALRPWELSNDSCTPIGLFFKLLLDEYGPLHKYLDANINDFTSIISLLLCASHDNCSSPKKKSDDHIKELIEAGFWLAQHKVRVAQTCSKNMEPIARAKIMGQEKSKIKRERRANERKQKILQSAQDMGPFVTQQDIATRLGLSQATVSRALRDASY